MIDSDINLRQELVFNFLVTDSGASHVSFWGNLFVSSLE